MMKLWAFCVSVFLILWLITPAAWARAIEVKSENFILVGNVSPGDAKKLVLDLEQYRQGIMQLLGLEDHLEPVLVRIYTAQNSKALADITGVDNIGGIYTTNIEGPIFMLNSMGGFNSNKRVGSAARSRIQNGSRARSIALHEYTHHFLASYTNQYYPRWYNEGFADYLSTFKVDRDGNMLIGTPHQPYTYALSQRKWMPSKTVVGAINRYPFISTPRSRGQLSPQDFFYAQSWLAVHYLLSNKEDAAKIRNYIDTLNSENRPKNAFEAAFGRPPEEFHLQLKEYYKQNSYSVAKIIPKRIISEASLQVRKISTGEALFHKAESMRYFRGGEKPSQEIINVYLQAAKKLGKTPAILAGIAELKTWQDDFTGAESYINSALALAPNDQNVNHIAGMILVYKNEDQTAPANLEELKRARKHLKTAMRGNPDNISAHFYYVKTYYLSNKPPSAQALASAELALNYYRSRNFVKSNLILASVLMRGGKTDLVRPAVYSAILWGSDADTLAIAYDLKERLDRIQTRTIAPDTQSSYEIIKENN